MLPAHAVSCDGEKMAALAADALSRTLYRAIGIGDVAAVRRALGAVQEVAHRAARAQIPANPRGGHPHDRGVLGAPRGLLYDLRPRDPGAPGT